MLRTMVTMLARIHRDERGQSMVEYAIVTALIAVVAMVAVGALGTAVATAFNNIVNALGKV